jgi:hypothetical protein
VRAIDVLQCVCDSGIELYELLWFTRYVFVMSAPGFSVGGMIEVKLKMEWWD